MWWKSPTSSLEFPNEQNGVKNRSIRRGPPTVPEDSAPPPFVDLFESCISFRRIEFPENQDCACKDATKDTPTNQNLSARVESGEEEVNNEKASSSLHNPEAASPPSSPNLQEGCMNKVSRNTPTKSEDNFPKIGIKLSYLIDEFVPKHQSKLEGLTTKEVCEQIIKPVTILLESSFCELLQQLPTLRDNVSDQPSAFISHAHMYKFLDVICALQYHLRDDIDTYVWFDIFSINQHVPTDWSFDWLATTFKSAIGQFGKVIMIMSPWNQPIPFTRAWCVYEAYSAAATNSKFEIALSRTDQQHFLNDMKENVEIHINNMLSNIQSEKAECFSESDKNGIFSVIQSEVGFTKLDSMLLEQYRQWVIDVTMTRIDELKNQNTQDVDEYISLLQIVAQLYEGQGKLNFAERHYEECLRKRVLQFGVKDHKTLESMTSLVSLYVKQSKYSKALELGIKNMERSKRVLGEDHPSTLTLMRNLACVYQHQQNYSEAISSFSTCLDMRRERLGESHLDTLQSLQDLANMHMIKQRYDQAESLYLLCFARRKKKLGLDHPETLLVAKQLADLYCAIHDFGKARKLYFECLERYKLKHGPKHPETLQAMDSLTYLYIQQKDYRRALPLCLQFYEERKTRLGEDSIETLESLERLAITYQELNLYDKSIPMFKKCISRRSVLVGKDHSDTKRIVATLQQLYDKLLRKHRSKYGIAHAETISVMKDMIAFLEDQEEYVIAVNTCQDLLAELKQLQRSSLRKQDALVLDPITATLLNTLAILVLKTSMKNKHFLASSNLTECYKVCIRHYGEMHPTTLASCFNVALFCTRNEELHDKAISLFQKCCDAQTPEFGFTNIDAQYGIEGMAEAYVKSDNCQGAIPLYVEYVNTRRQVWQQEQQKKKPAVENEVTVSSGDVGIIVDKDHLDSEAKKILKYQEFLSSFEHVLTNLAYMYWKVGNMKDLKSTLEECLEVKENNTATIVQAT